MHPHASLVIKLVALHDLAVRHKSNSKNSKSSESHEKLSNTISHFVPSRCLHVAGDKEFVRKEIKMEEGTHRCEVKACPHMTFRRHDICIPKGNTITQ